MATYGAILRYGLHLLVRRGIKAFYRKDSLYSIHEPGDLSFPGCGYGSLLFYADRKERVELGDDGYLLSVEYVLYNDDFTKEVPIANLVDEIFDLTVFNNDEIAFTWRINTPELVEAYQEGHLKGKLKEIAAGMHEEDNPVIMVAKYKR